MIAANETHAAHGLPMLPSGFQWRLTPGGQQTLFLGERAVASYQHSGDAWYVDTAMHRERKMWQPSPRVAVASQALAIRYAEAYVRKWETAIRDECAQGWSPGRRH